MKEVQMTFRVETGLRDAFSQAAELDSRPASQVLRELMRAYVDRSRAGNPTRVEVAVTDVERRRRQDAVNFSRASVGLEGFKPSEQEEAHAKRFVDGEIDLAEFLESKINVNPISPRGS